MAKYYQYVDGIGSTAAYQVSGRPYATGSLSAEASSGTAFQVDFPSCTRWFSIINRSDQDLRVGFSAIGTKGTNYFCVRGTATAGHGDVRYEARVREIYILSNNTAITSKIDIMAGLTEIPSDSVPSWSGSLGVG